MPARHLKTTILAGLLILSAKVWANPERATQIQTILGITQQAIANPQWLQTQAWQDFSADLQTEPWLHLDEVMFIETFNQKAAQLPFTHYRLENPNASSNANERTGVRVDVRSSGVAILDIDHFSMPTEVMREAVQTLRRSAIDHLILDLRDNPGGAFPAAFELSRYLSNQPVDTGVYLGRRWFSEHAAYPTPAQLEGIPALDTLTLEDFAEALQTDGAFRLRLPAHAEAIFSGHLYVLTSRQTASTAEPLVERLRRVPEGVTVIGEQTAGAMLSGHRIALSERLALFLPVADYLTDQGHRLDGVGVSPEIPVPAAQALDTALELIERKRAL